MSIDWTRVSFRPPGASQNRRVIEGGQVSPTDPNAPAPTPTPTPGAAPVLSLSAETEGKVTTVLLSADSETANLAAASWTISPSTDTSYGKTSRTGPRCVFKHNTAGTVEVTVTVPRTDGGPAVTATLPVTRGDSYVANVFPRAWTWGGEAMKVEHPFGFTTAGTRRARLVRTVSPGVPSERTVVAERDVTFEAGKAQVLTESITFTQPTGKGHGFEYRWEIVTGENTVVTSGPLPMWVYGSALSRQSLSQAPEALPYPGLYTRPATDSGMVTPATGYTYQAHVDKFIQDWKATHLGGASPGGAWLAFNDYNANLIWVDLNDSTIPRYTFRQWDNWQNGWTNPGWYGDDPWSKPYPRSKVAVDVPVPDNAVPSPGTDRSMTIVGMRGGKVERIWEFWLAQKMGDGQWRAASIGTTTSADDWRHSRGYTVSASGISAVAYALTIKQAQKAVGYVRAERAAGRVPSEQEIIRIIPQALAINQPDPRAGRPSYPATFSDGGSSLPTTAWEGQLVYLRQDIDVAAANLTPLKHVIAVVGKHKGFRVTDKTAWSTSMIVEGDQAYGGGIWSTLREPNESWAVVFPDSWFVIGKQYETKEAFDADTTSTVTPGDSGWSSPVLSDTMKAPLAVEMSGRAADQSAGGTVNASWAATSTDPGVRTTQATPEGLVLSNYAWARITSPSFPRRYTATLRLLLDRVRDGSATGRIKLGYTGSTDVVGVVVKHEQDGKLTVSAEGSYEGLAGSWLGSPAWKTGDQVSVGVDGRTITVRVGPWSSSFQATSAIDTAAPAVTLSCWGSTTFRAADLVITSPDAPTTPTVEATQFADRSPASSTAQTWTVPSSVKSPQQVEVIERAV